ncbi:hypothetical protein [Haloarcula sp. CBA1122]|uniref:hypothetical protein n=1 Tax=Haloarcula sp. CBA1122 TaxID=2668069 RepID=UPI001305ADE0|nr:hypothetical protein [Haloarcula sp. CBA1122]MUV49293.1 hypothetical protein [Haloarcula sp. CBA1122]
MVLHYVPIVRHGFNEIQVFEDFDDSLLGNVSPNQVMPVIEIIDEDDFNHLDSYREFERDLMIDLPRYLVPRNNKHQDDVDTIVSNYSSVADFYRQNVDNDDVPVVSGDAEPPIDYSQLTSLYNQLENDYDRLAIRIFVGLRQFDHQQEQQIRDLVSQLRDDDLVLIDLVDTAGFDSDAYRNAETIVGLLDSQETYILNAFKYDESNHNYGPVAAKELDISGFGDFVINQRFPQEMNFRPPTQYIRMFNTDTMELENFGGDGYDNAYNQMRNSNGLDPDHCEYCRQADSDPNWGPNFWKRVRMGHYISEVLDETLDRMESQTSPNLDSHGYDEIN